MQVVILRITMNLFTADGGKTPQFYRMLRYDDLRDFNDSAPRTQPSVDHFQRCVYALVTIAKPT